MGYSIEDGVEIESSSLEQRFGKGLNSGAKMGLSTLSFEGIQGEIEEK